MEYTEETFDKVMDLNIKGVFNATRAAAECMVARGAGVILSTSSKMCIRDSTRVNPVTKPDAPRSVRPRLRSPPPAK